jgi:hypothetical protein
LAVTEGLRWKITKAVRHSDLSSPAKLIMLVLADVADVGTAEIPPQWTPSLAGLAQETSLGRSTVAKHLKDLEELGWLKRSAPSPTARGTGYRTSYTLCMPSGTTYGELPLGHYVPLDQVQEPDPLVHQQDPLVQERDGSSPAGGLASPAPGLAINRKSDLFQISQIHDLAQRRSPATPRHDHFYLCAERGYRCLDEDPDFQAFWAAYPNRVSLGEARHAYAEATRLGADPRAITTGAAAYRDDLNRTAKYTMKPANWLREEKWLDQPVQVAVPRRPVVEGW